jgi:hypothetical protein
MREAGGATHARRKECRRVHRSICADTSGRRGRVPAQMDMVMVQGAVEDAPARVCSLTGHTRRADHGGYLRMATALV